MNDVSLLTLGNIIYTFNFFIIININIRVSLHATRLILHVLKLTLDILCGSVMATASSSWYFSEKKTLTLVTLAIFYQPCLHSTEILIPTTWIIA
jgi:hypothetical protein